MVYITGKEIYHNKAKFQTNSHHFLFIFSLVWVSKPTFWDINQKFWDYNPQIWLVKICFTIVETNVYIGLHQMWLLLLIPPQRWVLTFVSVQWKISKYKFSSSSTSQSSSDLSCENLFWQLKETFFFTIHKSKFGVLMSQFWFTKLGRK